MFRKLFRKVIIYLFPSASKLDNPLFCWERIYSYKSGIFENNIKIDPVYTLVNVKVGRGSYISQNSLITETNIGRYCSIGPNLLCGWGIHPTNGISTSPMFYSIKCQNGITLSETNRCVERKLITIGNDVYIGANVTILDGVKIGNGAVIGAGAVVSKDIPPYAVAVGCPIKIIRYRFSEQQIASLERIQWWNWDDEQLKDVKNLFFDIDDFIRKHDI